MRQKGIDLNHDFFVVVDSNRCISGASKCTVDENIIGAPTIQNNFWYPLKMLNFPILHNCYYNIKKNTFLI